MSLFLEYYVILEQKPLLMGLFFLLYARAMTKVWEKIERLRGIETLSIADFGTRRRHSFLWQDWCVQAMLEGLGEAFVRYMSTWEGFVE